jgi:hypothetical protein
MAELKSGVAHVLMFHHTVASTSASVSNSADLLGKELAQVSSKATSVVGFTPAALECIQARLPLGVSASQVAKVVASRLAGGDKGRAAPSSEAEELHMVAEAVRGVQEQSPFGGVRDLHTPCKQVFTSVPPTSGGGENLEGRFDQAAEGMEGPVHVLSEWQEQLQQQLREGKAGSKEAAAAVVSSLSADVVNALMLKLQLQDAPAAADVPGDGEGGQRPKAGRHGRVQDGLSEWLSYRMSKLSKANGGPGSGQGAMAMINAEWLALKPTVQAFWHMLAALKKAAVKP